jgi:hypothetical protein
MVIRTPVKQETTERAGVFCHGEQINTIPVLHRFPGEWQHTTHVPGCSDMLFFRVCPDFPVRDPDYSDTGVDPGKLSKKNYLIRIKRLW